MKIFENYFKERYQNIDFNFAYRADFFHIIIKLFYTLKFILNFFMKNLIFFNIEIKKIYKKKIYLNKDNKNKICFIIGNGPSIKNFNLSRLNKFDTFSVNNIYKHKYFKKFNLKYLCLYDGAYFNPTKDYHPISKKNPYTKEKVKELYLRSLPFNNLIKKDTTLIFPEQVSYKSQCMFKFFKNKKIIYLNLLSHHMSDFIPKNINLETGIPFTYNVIPWTICFAILLNYKKIYLVGCEQNMYINSDAHFFKNKKNIKEECKISNNIKNKKLLNKITQKQLYPGCSNHLAIWSTEKILQYHINLNEFAKGKGIKIYDCSKKGILDMYEHKNLSDINKL